MSQLSLVTYGNRPLTEVQYQTFLEWVSQTNLFDAIKSGSKAQAGSGRYGNHSFEGYATEYVLRYNGNELRMNRGVVINKPEDLPKELLLEFFINSPFYNPLEYTDDTPLIESHE